MKNKKNIMLSGFLIILAFTSITVTNVIGDIYVTKITANDGAFNDCFGISVSISGEYAAVGSYFVLHF